MRRANKLRSQLLKTNYWRALDVSSILDTTYTCTGPHLIWDVCGVSSSGVVVRKKTGDVCELLSSIRDYSFVNRMQWTDKNSPKNQWIIQLFCDNSDESSK